jgi:Ca2+-binding RTX toxin-like protein
MATVIGTSGNDILNGTFGDDVLLGQDGDDVLFASDGFDILDGGNGNDTADYTQLFGAITLLPTGIIDKFGFTFGNDQLINIETIIAPQISFFGGSRIDASQSGEDVSLDINLANNSLILNNIPAPGPSTLNFTIQNFTNVTGTSQNDSIVGDAQNNSINGSAGNDNLAGGQGNDVLNGGDFFLFGSPDGDDVLDGGEGDDTLIASGGNDTLDGGIGNDTADYSQFNGAITLLPTGIIQKDGFPSGSDKLINIDTIIAPQFSFFGPSQIDASTSGGTVSINVNLARNSLILNNATPDPLEFNIQNFANVTGTTQNDIIAGDFRDNVLDGDAGDDKLIASEGFDTLDGGIGSDTADYSQFNGSITLLPTGIINKLDGFFGFIQTDQLINIETIIAPENSFSQIDASTSGTTVSINVNLANNSLQLNNPPAPAPNPLTFTIQNFVSVIGTSQNDSITGDAEDNFLDGFDGNDVINGGDGSDSVSGGTGDDRLIGGQGDDFLDGGDFFDGPVGNDTADYSSLGQAITLEAVGVISKGTAGTDQIFGIETIIGATGKANAIDGSTGASNSTFFDIDLTASRLTVNDIPFLGSASFKVVNFANATGTSQNDVIFGNSKNNVFQGGLGDDTLSGEGGIDTLLGNGGNDTLSGGSGNDLITGGSGIDSLRGGTGLDRFQFSNPDEGIDTILDFVSGTDKITVSLAGFGAGLTKGALALERFVIGTRALDANDRFVFSSGQLFFDRDGSGGASQKQIATLTGAPKLVASDILVA